MYWVRCYLLKINRSKCNKNIERFNSKVTQNVSALSYSHPCCNYKRLDYI